MMFLSPLLGLWIRMPPVGTRIEDADMLADPEVRLMLTGRSGPLVVEIEYRVDQENARAFHNVMQEVQLSRQRNGAYGWSIARDIADPELWMERYHCPTWLDYLRQRNRSTQSERALHQRAMDFHLGPEPVHVRRMLERPFGSVRWKEDSPDRAANEVLPVSTAAGQRVRSPVSSFRGDAKASNPESQRFRVHRCAMPRNDDGWNTARGSVSVCWHALLRRPRCSFRQASTTWSPSLRWARQKARGVAGAGIAPLLRHGLSNARAKTNGTTASRNRVIFKPLNANVCRRQLYPPPQRCPAHREKLETGTGTPDRLVSAGRFKKRPCQKGLRLVAARRPAE